jgi:ABC-type glutathione transport system ATPase component
MQDFVKNRAETEVVGRCDAAASGTTLCRFEDISFTYPGGVEALSNVSFDVEAGSNLSIVGPSGCGKSTLLYVLANLLQPTSGSTELIDLDPGRHQLSMLFQKDTLLPWLTVAENISLFGTFRKSQRRRIRDNVDWLLRLARLENIRDSYPYQLSGGMRRLPVGDRPHPSCASAGRAVQLDRPADADRYPRGRAAHLGRTRDHLDPRDP